MLFYKSINEIPEDIYLESILNELTDEDDDLDEIEELMPDVDEEEETNINDEL